MFFTKSKTAENNIENVKKRLIRRFAIIAISTSFVVFLTFSLKLVKEEDNQIALYLNSFQGFAQQYYQRAPNSSIAVSPNITAYYDSAFLPDNIKLEMPYAKDEVTRVRSYSEDGFMVYHTTFLSNGNEIPLYLTIDTRTLDFGDDNWDILLSISTLLMLFLVGILSVSTKRMFDELMSPVVELSQQLRDEERSKFTVSENTIDEIKQLTNHLNSYTQMKERVVKQEMMFAKYASHELKTPIAIISGAANLQAMKEEDVEFQAKQRHRIIDAADNMQSTVEILLNIVKQENAATSDQVWAVNEQAIPISELSKKAKLGVEVELVIAPNTTLSFPLPVLKMILKNIVNNSIRFTEQGSITIHVATDHISVQDSGTGLSDKNQTDHGLGLLIVRRLCNVHGWSFELKDNINTNGCIASLIKKSR
ncbi:HAMP domain-containing histidine kinase [Vibrio sp. ZSDE26]|uniref:histidine kinase n=1 Tax=Vibrio amylolyticus TaxID=2847292 RepID=A0A9X2BM77_9VIBR|nr:HAMP domain-containing sensor histidine kinase [Vibrio amylolyticus]MCK6264653.1 HAMP domain-containing histidine kinase [Vibrio amylolyticus]